MSRAAIDRIRSGEAMDQEPEEAAFQRSHLGDLRPLGQNGQVPVVRIGSDRPGQQSLCFSELFRIIECLHVFMFVCVYIHFIRKKHR